MHQITSNIFGSVPIVQKYTNFLYLQKNGFQNTIKKSIFLRQTLDCRKTDFSFSIYLTTFIGLPSMYAFTFSTHCDISLWRASVVAHAMCGVM